MNYRGRARVPALGSIALVAALAPSAPGTGDFDWFQPGNARRSSLVSLGDLDGDGAGDFGVGGIAPRIIVLSGRDGSELVRFGHWTPMTKLAAVGDVNGDGRTDVLCTSAVDRVELYSACDGVRLHAWRRSEFGRGFGHHGAGGQDVDGDGVPDLIIGSRSGAFVFSGRTRDLLGRLHIQGSGADRAATWSLAEGSTDRDVSSGVRARAPVAPIEPVSPVALVPDGDGDGRADFLVGGTQALYVVSSNTGLSFLALSLRGLSHANRRTMAWELGALDDVDGDGFDEYWAVALDTWLRLYRGSTGGIVFNVDWSLDYMYALGVTADLAGDFDGDGIRDLLVAANEQGWDYSPGFVEVYSTRARSLIRDSRLHWYAARGTPYRGLIPLEESGVDACAIGDLDGDCVPEVALSAVQAEVVVVLSGRDFQPLWEREWRQVFAGR